MSAGAPPAFGFSLATGASAGLRRLRASVLGLGAAGLALAAWLARGEPRLPFLLGFGLLVLVAGWRHARAGLSPGCLEVDGQGRAAWRAPGAGPEAVRVERWFAGERLAWLRLRSAGGRIHEVLVGRAEADAETWRRLAAWLAWLRRGAAPES